MNNKSKSSYDTSFFIRMGVLLALLLIAGGAMAYDRLVLVPSGEEAVERVMKACANSPAEKAAIHKAAGCDPTSTEKAGEFEIDHWRFGRILPNLEGFEVSVVYLKGQVSEVFRGGMTDQDRALFK